MTKNIRVTSCSTCPFIGQRRFLQNDKRVCKDVCANPNSKPKLNAEWIIIVNKSLIHPECVLENERE